MPTITIPTAVADLLRNAAVVTHLVDEQGVLLGSFAPACSISKELTPEEYEEIKRRRQSNRAWLTTEQVLSRLESR